MQLLHSAWTTWRQPGAVLTLVAGLNACAVIPAIGANGAESWKEEVLLHDGKKIIAERETLRGGRHEVGQKGDYIAQSLRFTLPGTSQTIEWQDNRGEDLGNSSFLPMVLDIVNGIPYLVASPMGCLSYNKWGSPNPPYVVFKYDANAWKRIALEELPLEIKTPNLVLSMPDLIAKKEPWRFVTAQRIVQIVAEYQEPEYRAILRKAMKNGGSSCRLEFTNGKGNWLGSDWFSSETNLENCQRVCERKDFPERTCPCKQFFKEEK